jgi:hypothetical protein
VDGIVAKKSELQEIVANNQQLYTNRPVSEALGPAISLLSRLLFFLDNLTYSPHLYRHTLAHYCPPDSKKIAIAARLFRKIMWRFHNIE